MQSSISQKKKEENSQHVCQVNTNVIKLDVIMAKGELK